MLPQAYYGPRIVIIIFIILSFVMIITTFSSVGLLSIVTGMLPQAHSGPEETWIRQLERKKPLPGLQDKVNQSRPHLDAFAVDSDETHKISTFED